MIAGVVVFLMIVGIAVALRTGWRPSFKKSTAKPDDRDDKKSGGFWKTTGKVVGAIAGLWVALTLGTCFLSVGSGVKHWLTTPTPPRALTSGQALTPPARCTGSWDVQEIDIPAGGAHPLELCWGWSMWPIRGDVVLVTKSGKRYPLTSAGSRDIVISELQTGGTAIVVADGEKPARIAVKNRW